MRIEILHTPDCPNTARLRGRIAQVLSERGMTIDIGERVVASQRQAEGLGLRGSPTLLVDGEDPFAPAVAPSLSCRLYLTPDGHDGAPSLSQLREIILKT